MDITVTLTSGTTLGPFNIYYDSVDGGHLLASDVTRAALLSGYTVTGINDSAVNLIVVDQDPGCGNQVSYTFPTTTTTSTTTTTTTPAPTTTSTTTTTTTGTSTTTTSTTTSTTTPPPTTTTSTTTSTTTIVYSTMNVTVRNSIGTTLYNFTALVNGTNVIELTSVTLPSTSTTIGYTDRALVGSSNNMSLSNGTSGPVNMTINTIKDAGDSSSVPYVIGSGNGTPHIVLSSITFSLTNIVNGIIIDLI